MRVAVLLLLSAFSLPAFAVGYAASIEQSKWELEASKFSCRLSQMIPLFGEGEFNHEAGETVRFILKPMQGSGLSGSAQLLEEASPLAARHTNAADWQGDFCIERHYRGTNGVFSADAGELVSGKEAYFFSSELG